MVTGKPEGRQKAPCSCPWSAPVLLAAAAQADNGCAWGGRWVGRADWGLPPGLTVSDERLWEPREAGLPGTCSRGMGT